MRVAAAALVAASAVLAPSGARAAEVDPRYAFTLELDSALSVSGEFGGVGSASGDLLGRVSFFGPLAENLQGGGGLAVATDGSVVGHGGVRFLTDSEPWQSRFEVAGATRVWPRFGLGLRLAVGIGYLFAKGWRVGGELAASFLAIHVRAAFEPAAFLSYSF